MQIAQFQRILWILLLLIELNTFVTALTGFKDVWQLVYSLNEQGPYIKNLLNSAFDNQLASLIAEMYAYQALIGEEL